MRKSTILGGGCAALALCAGQAMAQISIRTVALTGTGGVYGPGLGAGQVFTWLGSPVLNSSAQAAFSGSTLAGAFNGSGVWLRPDGSPLSSNLVLYKDGDVRPGSMPSGPFPADTFPASSVGYQQLNLNDAGQTVARQSTTGVVSTSGTSIGMVSLGRVAYGNDLAPGSGGAAYGATPIPSSGGYPLFNQNGQSVYQASMTGTGVVTTSGSNNSIGIFMGTADNANNPNSNVSLVLRSADFTGITGLSSTMRVGSTFSSMAFNNNGLYVVQNTLQGASVVTGTGATSNSVALLTNRTGSPTILAQVGQPAVDESGAATTDVYRSFSVSPRMGMNNLNHVAYVATLRNGATATTQGIFSDVNGGVAGGAMRRVAISGGTVGAVYPLGNTTMPLPEFTGLTYSTSTTAAFSTVVMNSSDEIVFSANMSSGGQAYLLRDQAGLLHRVARGGDVMIPNDPNRATPGDTTLSSVGSIALNDMGQVAMSITLTGSGIGNIGPDGVTPTNSAPSLWVTDLSGVLTMVCRVRGTWFSDGMGSTKTIQSILSGGSGGTQDGGALWFNNNGDLTFGLTFTDGSTGNFIYHIPAPGSAGLLALGGLAAVRRRRR